MPQPIKNTKRYQSWGRYPKVQNSQVEPLYWRGELPDLSAFEQSILPFGYGRSYGDSCLNNGGILLDASLMRRFIAFDTANGILRCEAGVSLAEVLDLIVPRGWFLPVTPGTKYVSVAGAVANDIHGKNHHAAGTFGCHVTQFELLRSNGERLICSPDDNSEMFNATIGGLGLTGLILWVEFRLKKIESPFIVEERIRFDSLDEFWELTADSEHDYEYTVSWLDCLSGGKKMGRGIFFRGNHATAEQAGSHKLKPKFKLRLPIDIPSFLLNTVTVRLLNEMVYRSQFAKSRQFLESYEPFFYPLDFIMDWNRGYGKQGFLQYQCVVATSDNYRAITQILSEIRRAGEGSFVNVFKKFGDIKSPGMLSFPRPGITLALDFSYRGQRTLRFLDKLDKIVRDSGGAVYPAKDAHMSAESFQTFYPNWQDFAQYIDPNFSSSFWRRVTANGVHNGLETSSK
ncbi:MAG: FAD-binding oxidoreductase [Chloroflexota bacterium]